MKLSCLQKKLNEGISKVNRIVSPRGTLPVLNNILFKTDNGRLRISATDLEMGINTWIGAKVDKEGAITIPSRLVSEFVSANNDQAIEMELKETTLSLKSEKYKANIKGIDATEFPLIPEIKKEVLAEISGQKLKEAISRVAFACAIDETRPVLTGVFLKFKDNQLKIVATDSYRLAEKILTLDKKVVNETNIIVPQRTMNELSRIIKDDEKIELKVGENQILFSFGDTQLVSRLIEGNFPDYEQIIPKKTETKAIILAKDFANIMKMASFFARESANNVKLKISGDKKIDVTAISPQLGDNVSSMSAEIVGKDIEISFNSKFILDVLNIISDENIILQLVDKMSAGILKPEKSKDYLYLIMPLRVEE